jgi:hypothetical protein
MIFFAEFLPRKKNIIAATFFCGPFVKNRPNITLAHETSQLLHLPRPDCDELTSPGAFFPSPAKGRTHRAVRMSLKPNSPEAGMEFLNAGAEEPNSHGIFGTRFTPIPNWHDGRHNFFCRSRREEVAPERNNVPLFPSHLWIQTPADRRTVLPRFVLTPTAAPHINQSPSLMLG